MVIRTVNNRAVLKEHVRDVLNMKYKLITHRDQGVSGRAVRLILVEANLVDSVLALSIGMHHREHRINIGQIHHILHWHYNKPTNIENTCININFLDINNVEIRKEVNGRSGAFFWISRAN